MKKATAKKRQCPFIYDIKGCLVNDGIAGVNEGCMAWKVTAPGEGFCKRLEIGKLDRTTDCISPVKENDD